MDLKETARKESETSRGFIEQEKPHMAAADQSCTQISKDEGLFNSKSQLVEKWHEICGSGDYPIVYSFVTVSKDRGEFGVLSLTDDFVRKYGATLPFMIGLRCNNTLWCVNYDLEQKEFYGIGRLMKFYGLKILNLVQLDYYGHGIFKIRIFKETTLECKYNQGLANSVECSEEWKNQNRVHYVVDSGSLEFEKSISSVYLNASSNRTDYGAMLFADSDIDHSRGEMMLTPMWEELYKDWNNRGMISLKLLNRSWSIKFKKRGEMCYLKRGWLDFIGDVGLKDGDFLLAYREEEAEGDCLRVCTCSAEEHGLDSMSVLTETDKGEWSKSFFKIINGDMCARGMLVVSFLANEFYGWKLRQIRKLSMGGLDWGFYYKTIPGCIYNLDTMFKKFGIREKETILFTISETDVLYARIYQSNGSEIDYTARMQGEDRETHEDWLWSLDNKTVKGNANISGSEDPVEIENDGRVVQEFTACMSAGNVDKKTHGLFIPANMKPASGEWNRRQKIRFITSRGVWNIGITTSGSRPRFSAGWNAFIRGNEYTAGQMLNFRLIENNDFIDFEIAEI